MIVLFLLAICVGALGGAIGGYYLGRDLAEKEIRRLRARLSERAMGGPSG